MNRPAARLLAAVPWLLAGLIVLWAVATVPAFQRPVYWQSLGRQSFNAAALALALTPIVLTGGIDLSVGSVTVFCSVTIGYLVRDAGWPVGWAMLGGLVAGLLAGLANGALVAFGVVPLVATLATRELFRGLAFGVSGDRAVTEFPGAPAGLWRANWLGVPVPVWGLLALAVLTYLVVHHTWVGRMVYAVGDNETAARFAAVPVRRLKLGLYAAAGLVAGLCGAATVLHYGSARPDAEKSLELAAIACVVLGGVRITGGAGHVAGTVVGIITVSVLLAALSTQSPARRDVVTGALLVAVAVANEAARRLRRE
jgi:rhamnose transport system permease protein